MGDRHDHQMIVVEGHLGHLSEGAVADVTALDVLEGEFGSIDVDSPL